MLDVVVVVGTETMENGSLKVYKHLQVFCQWVEILWFHQCSMNTDLHRSWVDSWNQILIKVKKVTKDKIARSIVH